MISDPVSRPEVDALFGDHKMMLMSDPPYHTTLRRLISRDFTPRSTRELVDRLGGLARQVVDAVIEQGRCDLVSDLAGEMPSYVIADLMGLPLDDGRELYKLTEMLHTARDSITAEQQEQALSQMFAYAMQVYGDKQQTPGDDLSTTIIRAEVDGRQLDHLDFGLFFVLLVDAGGDTTRNLVAGGMHQLFEHPDQLHLLRSDLDRHLPNAIEEMLRQAMDQGRIYR
jgi:cytochrome P450